MATLQATLVPTCLQPPDACRWHCPCPEQHSISYYIHLQVNWIGMISFITYICALGFYLWVRITKTLGLGPYIAYGYFVLIVECLGATTVILYGTNLLWNPVNVIDYDDRGMPKVC